jgi:tetrahydromethanopterin S-methyltransferase subunit G
MENREMAKKTEEAVKRSEELHNEIYGQGSVVVTPETQSVQKEVVEPVADPNISAEQDNVVAEPATEQGVVTENVQATPVVPVAQDTPVVQADDNKYSEIQKTLDTFEQKYKTLQGKYNKETKRQQDVIDGLMKSLDDLTGEIKSLKTKDTVETPAQPKNEWDVRNYISEEEATEWGPEMANFISKIAKAQAEHIIEQKVNNIATPINERLDSITSAQNFSAQDVFEMRMAALVPDWKKIDYEDEFKEWLAEPDGLDGAPRGDKAKMFYKSLDVERLAKVFDAYKAYKKTLEPDTTHPPADLGKTHDLPEETPLKKPKKQPPVVANSAASHSDVNLYEPTATEKTVTFQDLRDAAAKATNKKISEEDFDKIRNSFIRQYMS